MASTYVTADRVTDRYPNLDNANEDELAAVIEAASRAIDGHCGRRFWLDDAATDRVFEACDPYVLDLGAHEIGSSASVTVTTDDGSGTFSTTVAASGFQLEPVNAPFAPAGAAPYTSVRRLDGCWPRQRSRDGRQDLVKITARYGWPSVPANVAEACMTIVQDRFENPAAVRSEAIDGYSVSYGAAQATRELLSVFVRSWAV